MKWQRGFFIITIIMTCGAAGWTLPITEISVDPTTQTVGVGDVFSVDVLISGAMDLSGFDLAVSFDPTILSWVGTTISPTAFLGESMVDAFYIVDSIGVTGVHLGVSGVSGAGTLFSLTFQALVLGVSNIGVSGQLANSTVQEIDPVQIDNGMVEVVPEPLSLTLIGVGTVGSTMVLRKRGRRG